MKLSELLWGLEISETNIEDLNIEIGNICDDSREVEKGDLFIALAGHSCDGHGYINEALERRAAVIVIERKECSGDFQYIRVPSTRIAYATLWSNLCGRPADRMRMIAVTGTNGKSTVVSMIEHILSCSGRKVSTIGTLNSSLTTPDPCELYPRLKELADSGIEFVVMEASSHALELEKLRPIFYEIAAFTNLTRDHLDFHGTMEAYAAAKAKLFCSCDTGLYNYDDDYIRRIAGEGNAKKLFYSAKQRIADFTAENIQTQIAKSRFDFLSEGELFRIEMPLTGDHNVSNALCAVSVCRILGVDKNTIRTAMSSMKGISGRMERVDITSTDYKAFIDYAHTPDALYKVLSALRNCMNKENRLICIFGCGGDRDRGKRKEMGAIASALSDLCIITSDNSRSEDPYMIIRDILSGVEKDSRYLIIENRERAIQYAVHTAKAGDVLVFCGKGHESYEINAYGKTEFNEKKIIQDADKERNRIKGNEYNSRRQDENVSCRNSKNNRR
ncbi:MAG: UDP-N-acetylmuramoyl-L-alanyl-D-glutamate--2,6-diaminopimelate ligase [Ruminococcaceae bacterium]|nr:UDP-N-acetylmuramoyl-L-alanyl-D-glutamate--2,6-diaminopimelate ligase [Oscillospiraceae bacterium]